MKTIVPPSPESCNHIVGYGSKPPDWWGYLYADDVGSATDDHDPDLFNFCPLCGKDISIEAGLVKSRILAHFESYFQEYEARQGKEHGFIARLTGPHRANVKWGQVGEVMQFSVCKKIDGDYRWVPIGSNIPTIEQLNAAFDDPVTSESAA